MKYMILVVSLVVGIIVSAFGEEVIFYEGFDDAEFPSTGWSGINIEQGDEGYNSDHYAILESPVMWEAHYNYYYNEESELQSPSIPVIGGTPYQLQLYYLVSNFPGYPPATNQLVITYHPTGTDTIFFSDNPSWFEINENLYPPPDTSSMDLFFDLLGTCDSQTGGIRTVLAIDEITIVGQVVGIKSVSLGQIKTAFR